jgi:DMSO/TMAO reductase YedYZ molybdopterin-dependent catalytic subunit
MLGNTEARTMRVLLVLLAILLVLPGEVGARRGKRVLVIRDYTSAAWEGVVEQTVADFNAVMPQRGPDLRYERMEATSCEALVVPRPRDRFVALCSVAAFDRDFGALFLRGGVLAFSDRYTGPWYDQFRATVVCHEFMHLLTNIPDNDGALPDQSCVWGDLSQPGSFDIDRLRETYRRNHR